MSTFFLLAITMAIAFTDAASVSEGSSPAPSSKAKVWAYATHTEGKESDWGSQFPTCGEGRRQSPIDIPDLDKGALYNIPYMTAQQSTRKCHPIKFGGAYVNEFGGRVRDGYAENNGHTVLYALGENVEATITGGVLGADVFQLHSFHVHWGSEDWRGSEHTVDGKAYPAELHFVHYNTKYGNLSSAINHQDGLAVIGVFFKVGCCDNPELNEIKFSNLHTKGMKQPIKTLFLNNLLPTVRNYYTYEGSLTTPPCSESVRWIVMQHPIDVSTTQMWDFRRIYGENDEPIQNNYRPPQPKLGRKVRLYLGTCS